MLALARAMAFAGLALLLGAVLVWLVARLGVGRAGFPGTLVVRRGNGWLWAPVGLCIVLSVVVTVVLNVLARLFH